MVSGGDVRLEPLRFVKGPGQQGRVIMAASVASPFTTSSGFAMTLTVWRAFSSESAP